MSSAKRRAMSGLFWTGAEDPSRSDLAVQCLRGQRPPLVDPITERAGYEAARRRVGTGRDRVLLRHFKSTEDRAFIAVPGGTWMTLSISEVAAASGLRPSSLRYLSNSIQHVATKSLRL
jgi:hypothetical protein